MALRTKQYRMLWVMKILLHTLSVLLYCRVWHYINSTRSSLAWRRTALLETHKSYLFCGMDVQCSMGYDTMWLWPRWWWPMVLTNMSTPLSALPTPVSQTRHRLLLLFLLSLLLLPLIVTIATIARGLYRKCVQYPDTGMRASTAPPAGDSSAACVRHGGCRCEPL